MGRLRGLRVYLAGPMERAANGGVSWRAEVTPRLEGLGLLVLDPTARSSKVSLTSSCQEDLDAMARLREGGSYDLLASRAAMIVRQDLQMVSAADFVLANFDSDVPTFGTIDEIVTALGQGKPVLLACRQGLRGVPVWMWGRIGGDYRKCLFDSLDELMRVLGAASSCEEGELAGLLDMDRWLMLRLNVRRLG